MPPLCISPGCCWLFCTCPGVTGSSDMLGCAIEESVWSPTAERRDVMSAGGPRGRHRGVVVVQAQLW